MNKLKELNSHNSVPRKGISWRAIFAGVICTLSIVFLLNLLGLSFGFATIEPAKESDPLGGLGTASLVWWALSNLLALFVGSYVAARVGVSFYHKSGIVQGIMTWALFIFISVWLVTSAVGGIVSGVGNTIGSVFTLGDDQQQSQAQQLDEEQSRQLDRSLEMVKQDFYKLLEDTQKPALDLQQVGEKAENVMQNAQEQARQAAQTPGQIDAELEKIFSEARNRFDNTWEALDKEALTNILVERTNLNQSEARETVDNYVFQYENLRKKSEQFLEKVKQQAQETAGKISDAMGDAALYLFIALVLGAIVAALGGAAGVKSLRSDYMDSHYIYSSYNNEGNETSNRNRRDRDDLR